MSKIEIKTLKLSVIQADENQVRKTFNEDSINELAQSIKQHGLIQPITVRKVGKKYEIIAGERRFRACKVLGKKQMDCIVSDLDSDQEKREVQLVENLQRENVDKIEEAEAIRHFLDIYSLQEIADKIGKSYAFVRQRANLGNLTPYFKEAVRAEKISISNAIKIGNFLAEEQDLMAEHIGDYSDISFISKYTIDALISEKTQSLENAPFDTEDKNLLPKAGACVTCPFNDINMGNMFGDKKAICTKAHCFETKKKKGLLQLIEEVKKSKDLLIPNISSWNLTDKKNQEILKILEKNQFKNYCGYQVDYFFLPGEKPTLEKVAETYRLNLEVAEELEEAQEDLRDEMEDYNSEIERFEEAKKEGYVKGLLLNPSDYSTTEVFVKIPSETETQKVDNTPVSQKKMDDCTADEKIIKIKNKEVRKKEIEGGKEFEEIVSVVSGNGYLDLDKPISEDEKISFCITAFQNNVGWYNRELFKNEKFFDLDCKDENYFEEFKKVYHEGIYNKILRYFIQTQVVLGESTPKNNKTDNAFYAAVKPYYKEDIEKVENAFKEREKAREAKLKERIAELEKELEASGLA